MKKASGPDADHRLWGIVAATVRPLRGRSAPGSSTLAVNPAAQSPAVVGPPSPPGASGKSVQPIVPSRNSRPPQSIEPGRRRRLDRGRDPPAASVDLHGLNQDQARAILTRFLLKAWAENRRTILVITGKGALGDGILRRRAPEWLAEPPLRRIVAGLSEAHRRHGGEGALYVALKRVERGYTSPRYR